MEILGDNEYVWIVIILLLVAVFIAAVYIYERKRAEALQAAARSLGLSFEKTSNIDIEQRFGSFNLFSEGRRKEIKNCISGKLDGADVMVFGYSYRVGSGKNSSTRRQTVICFHSSKLTVPAFELRPEHLLHKIAGVFGYQDIDISSYPDFSKSYLLRGNDETSIRKVFSPMVISHFEKNKGLSVEVNGDTLICYRQSKRVRPTELKDFLYEGRAVFGLFHR